MTFSPYTLTCILSGAWGCISAALGFYPLDGLHSLAVVGIPPIMIGIAASLVEAA